MSEVKYTYEETNREGFLKSEDSNIINSFRIATSFNYSIDKIELYIYALNNAPLLEDINYTRFKVIQEGSTLDTKVSTIQIDPIEDTRYYNFLQGDVRLSYNFIRKITENNSLFIHSISPDRSEVLLYSTVITDDKLRNIGEDLSKEFLQTNILPRITIRIDGENYLQGINIGTSQIDERYFIKVKLYNPLPPQFSIKTKTSLVRVVSEPVEYIVTGEQVLTRPQQPALRGPNFNIEVEKTYSIPTEPVSISDILDQASNLVYSKTGEVGAEINIDPSDYSSFVHFSSAQERLKNFQYKLLKIEELELAEQDVEKNSILETFDHYERFLYYGSGSLSWPKDPEGRPLSPTETDGQAFFESQLSVAADFDINNSHRLLGSIPSFLREDPNNEPYNLFIDMIGQHFDNIWLYARGMTDRYNADNRLEYGISKDLVADALRGFGIKLYGSNLNLSNLVESIGGAIQEGEPEEEELENDTISVSDFNTPSETYQKEIFKRIYHNLPLLLKSKGTDRGLRALLNIFGIPKEFIDIRYFRGQNYLDTPFYGPNYSTSRVANKIKLDNTGSNYEFTLVENTKINQSSFEYDQEEHILEIGVSPANSINSFLISSSFDLNGYTLSDIPSTVGQGDEVIAYVEGTNNEISEIYIDGSGEADYTVDIRKWLSTDKPTLVIKDENNAASYLVADSLEIGTYFRLAVSEQTGSLPTPGLPVTASLSPYGSQSLLPYTFNIDNYIGDPRTYNSPEYPELNKLSENTFSGSFQRYNLYDFIRLLKFYDNTLFKMIKDFTPGRTNTLTGLIIKPHILERNKVKSVEVSIEQPIYSGSIELLLTQGTYGFDKTGDGYIPLLTSSFGETVLFKQGGRGVIRKLDSLYTGEFGAARTDINTPVNELSKIVTTSRELNKNNVFKRENLKTFSFRVTLLTDVPEDLGLSIGTVTHISP